MQHASGWKSNQIQTEINHTLWYMQELEKASKMLCQVIDNYCESSLKMCETINKALNTTLRKTTQKRTNRETCDMCGQEVSDKQESITGNCVIKIRHADCNERNNTYGYDNR